ARSRCLAVHRAGARSRPLVAVAGRALVPVATRIPVASPLGHGRIILHAAMSPDRSPDPATVRRVLIVRPRFIGDVCLTLPALEAVRAACPAARVAYVVERPAAPLLLGDPRVDELIVAEPRGGPGADLSLAARLRRFAPDVALDFFCNPRTALWTFASGARARVGYPHKGWRSALYTHHVRPRTLSATGFHLASLEALGWAAPARPSRPPARASAPAPARAHAAPLAGPAGAPRGGLPPRAPRPAPPR